MKYKIVSDSACDLLSVPNVSFASVPLKIITDEKEFSDDNDLDISNMLCFLEKYKGHSRTSCPNTAEWEKAFSDSDNIFCVTITSTLSGSCNAARTAAKNHRKSYPDKKIYVIDTLSTGPEAALIIEKLRELILSDMAFEDIIKEISEYQKHTHLVFSLESMHNLANNGRVSPFTAKLAGVLGIRVVGKASERGTLEVTNKTRGERKMLSCIAEKIKENGYGGKKIRIHHCENPQSAELIKEAVTAVFPKADIDIRPTRGINSFYAERGGLIIAFEDGTN